MTGLRIMVLGLALCAAAPLGAQSLGAQSPGAQEPGSVQGEATEGAAVRSSSPPGSPPAALALDLNALQEVEGACRLIFVAENRLGADLAALVFEAVLFTPDGAVDRVTLLDFQDLPQNRRRVRQFDLPGPGCAGFGQVLMNAAPTCAGEGLAPSACMAGLALSSRVAIGLGG